VLVDGKVRRGPVSGHSASDRGESRLMFAVLEDAIRLARCPPRARPGSRHREIREALEWIFSDDRLWPFSFLNVCDALSVDAARLRSILGPRAA
jgi:hypothetical protein